MTISEKQLKELKTGDPVILKLDKQTDQFPNATFDRIVDDEYVLLKTGNAGAKIKTSKFLKYGVLPGEEKVEAAKPEAPKEDKKSSKKKK